MGRLKRAPRAAFGRALQILEDARALRLSLLSGEEMPRDLVHPLVAAEVQRLWTAEAPCLLLRPQSAVGLAILSEKQSTLATAIAGLVALDRMLAVGGLSIPRAPAFRTVLEGRPPPKLPHVLQKG
jgi:hypothetical protein